MKTIDWNDFTTYADLFENIAIHSHNEGCFDPFRVSWIKNVTNHFGDNDASIAQNLLNCIQKKVDSIKCYHGTRLLYPRKIKREGLKKLSPNLIFKLCKQAEYYPNNTEKKFIRKQLEEFISNPDGVGESRCHIYFTIDKYLYLYNEEDNVIRSRCSFFWGSEGLRQIRLGDIFTKLKQSMESHGIPTVVIAHVPLNNKFFTNHQILLIATHFFSSWFNFHVLNQPQFNCQIGLDIPQNIKPRYIREILTYPKYRDITSQSAYFNPN